MPAAVVIATSFCLFVAQRQEIDGDVDVAKLCQNRVSVKLCTQAYRRAPRIALQ